MELTETLIELPEGWEWTTIKEVTLPYETIQPAKEAEKEFQYIDIGSINNSTQTITSPKSFLGKDAPSRARRVVKKDDVLFSTVRTYLKNIACVPVELDGVLTSTGIAILRSSNSIDSKFLFHLVSSEQFIQKMSSSMDGTLYPAVTDKDVSAASIPLPPLNEQRRIVEAIDQLRDRSQKARSALSAIPALCNQFRQSVLAAAFRGDLTADWREQNPCYAAINWHTGLLQTVRASLPETKRQGRLWGSGTFVEDIDETWDDIPENWIWVKVVDLGYDPDLVVQIGPMSMKSSEFVDEGNVVLNVGCVHWDGINLDKCNYLPHERAVDFERYRVKANDILFTRSGAVGRSAIVPLDLDGALITFHLLRVRTALDICLPMYLYYIFRGCPAVQSQIEDSAIGATRAGFNTKLLQNIWIPLPPVAEQRQVLQEIEERFNTVSLIETQLHYAQNHIETLDRAILAKAFRGELVEQNPTDESAALLLQRIQADRQKLDNNKPAKSRKRKATQTPDPQQLDLLP